MTPSRASIFVALALMISMASRLLALSPAITPQHIHDAMKAVADWQLAHPSKHALTDWTQGALDAGMMALSDLPAGKKYEDAMLQMGATNDWKLGPRLYHADDHAVGMTYAELYMKHKTPIMIRDMQRCFDAILAKPSQSVLDFTVRGCQSRWSWCDSLFMSPPAWLRLYVVTGERKYLDFMNAQWWATTDFLYDKEEHLYYRDSTYFPSKRLEANGKKVFWGRGNGWAMAGLARVLQYLPKDHGDRARYEALFKAMAEKIRSLQQEDGLWRASLLDPASYPLKETSGSGFYCFALAWGINNGLLDRPTYEPTATKAWAALVDCVQDDGRLTHVQPIGADPKKFDPTSTEVYGVGAFLLAGSEMYKLANLPAPLLPPTDPLGNALHNGLAPEHPRLLMRNADLLALKKQQQTDPLLQRYVCDVLTDADRQLAKPALKHEIPDGLRLLAVSRECLNRTLSLGFAYRWTGDRKYAEKGIWNLLTVCAFPDWNPRHFLDTAEMSAAVGIGYDWLLSAMSDKDRETIRAGLIKHGLSVNAGWGVSAENNWNMVCNGGLLVGSLAVADTDPEFARSIITRALKNIPRASRSYAPHGAWMEGPGYWEYATSYMVLMMAALDSALGHDFNIASTPGLDQSGYFPIYTTAPSGHFLCFADAGSPTFNTPDKPFHPPSSPCLFWLSRKYHNSDFSDAEHDTLSQRKATALDVVWYRPPTGKTPSRSLDRFFDGRVPIFLMRGSWTDPNTLWCGVKAGFNKVNHGHLDLGNFELEAHGIRWAIDLGADNYNLPGYFGKQRWNYYRLVAESHNVPLIGGKGQLPDGVAQVLSVRANQTNPSITIDLTSAYRDRAEQVIRTVSMNETRTSVTVSDRFTLQKPTELIWGMTTDADIQVKPDGTALLTRNGKHLSATIIEPSQAVFTVGSAEQKPPQRENKGIRRLLVTLSAPAGNSVITVTFNQVPIGNIPTTIQVENTLDIAREQETVELPWTNTMPVTVREQGRVIPYQVLEDKLLFQANFAPHETKHFQIAVGSYSNFPIRAYGRYVPERMDDYAWENDRIAFRVYGPALELPPPRGEKLAGSGVDVWCKRTRSLVLDKWYKSGAYHIDHGEGCDCYKSGASRACGGIGVWDGQKLFVSRNWRSQKCIANGPIRTLFELVYDTWDGGTGIRVRETRRISLDAGSNLSRFESLFTITGSNQVAIAVGLDVSQAHHHGGGTMAGGAAERWITNWEQENKPNGITGTAILLPDHICQKAESEGNLMLVAPAFAGKPFIWYAGAGWNKSGDFADEAAWRIYVETAMKRLQHPLKVSLDR